MQSMNGSLSSTDAIFDLQEHTLELGTPAKEVDGRGQFTLVQPHADELVLDGIYEAQRLHVTLRRTPLRVKLMFARFQWPIRRAGLPFSP